MSIFFRYFAGPLPLKFMLISNIFLFVPKAGFFELKTNDILNRMVFMSFLLLLFFGDRITSQRCNFLANQQCAEAQRDAVNV